MTEQARPRQIELIVGLGNPGPDYARTRHNAGFTTLDALADRAHVTYWKDQAGAQVGIGKLDGREIIFAKPLSYMNLSGGPVSKLLKLYGLEADQMLVIHDELDIGSGDIRVKFAGGHGGHHGLSSIIDKCQSRSFSRIRFGIGRPPGRMPVADYVLQPLKGRAYDDFLIQAQEAADIAQSCVERGVIKTRDTQNARHKDTPSA